MPSGFAAGKGGGGVGEERNCLGRDEVSVKLPDCGSWDVTTLGACKAESSLSLLSCLECSRVRDAMASLAVSQVNPTSTQKNLSSQGDPRRKRKNHHPLCDSGASWSSARCPCPWQGLERDEL